MSPSKSEAWRVAAPVGLVAFCALSTQCTCSEPAPLPGAVNDAGMDTGPADAIDAGDGDEPWDPVWHETEPEDWPAVGPEGLPDCGPGCRLGLHLTEMHPSYHGHAFSPEALAEVNTDEGLLFYSRLGSDKTVILGQRQTDERGYVEPFLAGNRLISLHSWMDSWRAVEIIDVVTGERKRAFEYQGFRNGDPDTVAANEVSFTSLNSKYAFWSTGSATSMRNLQSGEIRKLTGECGYMCATESGVLCLDGNYFVDQETGTSTKVHAGNAMQTEAACSPERTRVIWVDYRDPPGPGSDWMAPRNGGEIYMKDLSTEEVRRLTFDSPDTPKGKTYPAVGESLAVWKEVPTDRDPNPVTGQELYASTWDLIVLDLATAKKCRIHSETVKYFVFMSVHGRWVYGVGNDGYYLGVDVDHPAIGCAPY